MSLTVSFPAPANQYASVVVYADPDAPADLEAITLAAAREAGAFRAKGLNPVELAARDVEIGFWRGPRRRATAEEEAAVRAGAAL